MQAGIDKEIRLLLREKQQHLAKIILEHNAIEREISRIDSLIIYDINESLYFHIADVIIRAEQVYIDKNTILQLNEKLQQVAKILIKHKLQEEKHKLQEDSVELRRQSEMIKIYCDVCHKEKHGARYGFCSYCNKRTNYYLADKPKNKLEENM